ncbi:unnamed protein product [Nippostrongylus brasiliensis]|uniref:Probable cytochrome P450 CYP36A1 (inferred by orthology to a C. elegans protein) n=1 Tax=Nippostrongylus brasiliensis TaxID=27835 RepID=A0A0N4YVV0_NIPBR|nr:unnamed protein product [Nippostrongylus brasiliensis]
MEGIDVHLLRLKKIYGDVFTLWLPFPTVVIGGHEALKRTIVRDGESYAGRPDTYIMVLLVQGNYGLLFEENDWYRSQRRFTIQTLKNLGVGKDAIKNAVGNVINQLAFGYVRPPEDTEIVRFQFLLNEVFEHFNSPKMLLLDVVPFLRHFDHFLGLGIESTLHGNDAILEFIQKEFENHKRMINYDQEPTNYLDAYIHEIHRREKEGIKDEFTEKQCVVAIYDLYSAGLETIVNTLRFCFIFILNYPLIQERIHKEIDDAIGREREITMDDQKILPYTCAFLQEVYRAGYVVSVNFLRITTEDVECEGYKLRRGTRVIPQFPSVHMDESIYPRPELIIPERHLKVSKLSAESEVGESILRRSFPIYCSFTFCSATASLSNSMLMI